METSYIVDRRSTPERRVSTEANKNDSDWRTTNRRTSEIHPHLVILASEGELELVLSSLNALKDCEFYAIFEEGYRVSRVCVVH